MFKVNISTELGLAIIAILLTFVFTFWFSTSSYEKKLSEYKAQVEASTVETIIVKHDTVIDSIPYPMYITRWKYDTLSIGDLDTIQVHDTTRILIPISKYYFHKDSVYDLWASGYKVVLDSIKTYNTQTISNTTKVLETSRKWQIGVHTGLQYMCMDNTMYLNKVIPSFGFNLSSPSMLYFGGDVNFYNEGVGYSLRLGYYLNK